MNYIVEGIRKHSGGPTSIDAKLSGKRAHIEGVMLGAPLILRFSDGKTLVSSKVEAYNADWETSNSLVVQTKNSVYVLRKEAII